MARYGKRNRKLQISENCANLLYDKTTASDTKLMKNGDVWSIKTNGGMNVGFTKNIDMQVENKFKAFRDYAQRYGVLWGFMRDIDEELFICNTKYTEDMNGENWKPLNEVLKG